MPDNGEVAGLLALMLLTDARRAARVRPDGALVPLIEQNRNLWDASAIAEGVTLITRTLASAPVGPYQLQAAIAAIHDEAVSPDDTDWPQILALYDLLQALTPGPMVTLNHIVALAMTNGPELALHARRRDRPCACGAPPRRGGPRAPARDGRRRGGGCAAFRVAATRTLSLPEQRYLLSRAARRSPGTSTRRSRGDASPEVASSLNEANVPRSAHSGDVV